MENQYLKRILVIILAGILAINYINAQRVFVASENGKIEEVKEGSADGKISRSLNLPKKIINTLSEPFSFYIETDTEFDYKEWKVYVSYKPLRDSEKKAQYVFPKNYMSNKFIRPITDNIIEFKFPKNYFPFAGKVKIDTEFQSEIVLEYKPNKKNKKDGFEESIWIIGRTVEDYDPEEISWSDEDVIASINEIIDTKQTTKQLFASLVPEPQQIKPGNGQVQYVVVQNQNAPVQGNEVAQQSKEPEIPNSDVDLNIPFNGNKIENGFALIIANEDYTKVAPVPFAKRDGKKVEEYINKALGIDKGHITLLENATLNDMRYELSRLQKISDAYNGDCSFIVYYCGHGIPDEKNGNGYLLPVDGYGTDVNTAYSLAELYSHLGNLNAKKTILFTDACFSGAGKEGNMLVAARGIAIKSKANEATGNLIAFSACQGDETAYSYKDKGHGLMTYYFLKKLQESQGKATLGELEEYIIDNVGKTAIVTNGKSQTPSVSVSPTLQSSWRQQTLFE